MSNRDGQGEAMSDTMLDRVTLITKPPAKPAYSPWGYVIVKDGSTYALLHQWWHGVVLALLFPKEAEEQGFVVPFKPWVGDVNPHEYQRFELDNHTSLPAIRVCPSRALGPPSIDRGLGPASPEQIDALRLVVKLLGLKGDDEIALDHKDVSLKRVWEYLKSTKSVWEALRP